MLRQGVVLVLLNVVHFLLLLVDRFLLILKKIQDEVESKREQRKER